MLDWLQSHQSLGLSVTTHVSRAHQVPAVRVTPLFGAVPTVFCAVGVAGRRLDLGGGSDRRGSFLLEVQKFLNIENRVLHHSQS